MIIVKKREYSYATIIIDGSPVSNQNEDDVKRVINQIMVLWGSFIVHRYHKSPNAALRFGRFSHNTCY